MKIAFFHAMSLRNGGGCENNFIRMASALAEKEEQVSVCSFSEVFHRRFQFLLSLFYGTIFRRGLYSEGRFSEADVKERLGKARWRRLRYKTLRKALQEADVIYTKNEILDLLLLRFLRVRGRIICGMHTNVHYAVAKGFHARLHNFLYRSFFYKWLIKPCSFFRVLNQEDQQLLQKAYSVHKDQIFLVGNGVDGKLFSPSFSVASSPFTALFVGRLGAQKGIMDVAELICHLRKKGLAGQVVFRIVGSGPQKEDFLDRIESTEGVEFLEGLSYPEMPSCYGSADVCLVPSCWETFNSVVLEAQSCGVPVIAYDIPGPREMILDKETGYLVKPGDKEVFFRRFIELLTTKDSQQYRLLREKARQNVLEKFSHEVVFSRLHDIISSVAE